MSCCRRSFRGCSAGVLSTLWAGVETGLIWEVLESGVEKEERLGSEIDISDTVTSKSGVQARPEPEQETGQLQARPQDTGGRPSSREISHLGRALPSSSPTQRRAA